MNPMHCIEKAALHPLLGEKKLVIRYYRGVVRQTQTMIRRTVTYRNYYPVHERVEFDQEFWIRDGESEKRFSPLGFVAPLLEGQTVTVVTVGSRTRHFCLGVFNHTSSEWIFINRLQLFFSNLWGPWMLLFWFLLMPLLVLVPVSLALAYPALASTWVVFIQIGFITSLVGPVIGAFLGVRLKNRVEAWCRESLAREAYGLNPKPQNIYR
jgi:hypothetical protein